MDETPGDKRNELDQLERQVERGTFFTHTALTANADRLHEAETLLYALIDTMVAKGALTSDEIVGKVESVRQERAQNGEVASIGVGMRVDNNSRTPADYVPVNCAERMHICHAVCCRLSFALSAPEIEGGHVKWDLGQPYYIRQERDGYCTHSNHETRACGIYANRPHVCRIYSCANDERIWKDFERMELNDEWIAANLHVAGPRVVQSSMTLASPERGEVAPNGD